MWRHRERERETDFTKEPQLFYIAVHSCRLLWIWISTGPQLAPAETPAKYSTYETSENNVNASTCRTKAYAMLTRDPAFPYFRAVEEKSKPEKVFAYAMHAKWSLCVLNSRCSRVTPCLINIYIYIWVCTWTPLKQSRITSRTRANLFRPSEPVPRALNACFRTRAESLSEPVRTRSDPPQFNVSPSVFWHLKTRDKGNQR